MIRLKWGKIPRSQNESSYVSYGVIGKVFGIDASSVSRLVKKRIEEVHSPRMKTRESSRKSRMLPLRQRYGYRFLNEEHIEFLTSEETLQRWSGKSLARRCTLFHRHFGNHRINPTLLRKVYRLHKIKRKRIKLTKLIKPEKEEEYEAWRQDMKKRIEMLKN